MRRLKLFLLLAALAVPFSLFADVTNGIRGKVEAIDPANGTIDILHEQVPDLGWRRMSMDFPLADKALVNGVSVGDEIVFAVRRLDGGRDFEVIRVELQ
jgi:Cu/Ag efflux protein CusF